MKKGVKWLLLGLCLSFSAFAEESKSDYLIVHAAHVFDGFEFVDKTSVLLKSGRIVQIGDRADFNHLDVKRIDLGDATLLPGFIELHAHLAFQHVSAETVLKHGVTTLRDVGGPVHEPYGGDGRLRVLTSGRIITAVGGYPIPGLGESDIAVPVSDELDAREAVRKLVQNGAVIVKIALEPGGEIGAPWSSGHHHAGHVHGEQASWPLLPEKIVKAIVDEAHGLNRKVTAHIAEPKGAAIALNAGVDEWAHAPCEALPKALLEKAVAQNVKIITTLDALSKCPGIESNVKHWVELGADFLYGAEIAHPDIPWGIDAQELIYIQHMMALPLVEVLKMATSKAGRHLGMPMLGTLQAGAPADMIAVKGDLNHSLKMLEYPDLVVSGGKVIVNHFEP